MKGFTLIELLVTITIIVLVTGGSLTAYLTFNESRQMDIDARDFNSLLNRVRAKSIFLEYPADCTGLLGFVFASEEGSSGSLDSVKYWANCNSGVRGETVEKILNSSEFSTSFTMGFSPSTGNLTSGEDQEIVLESLKGAARTRTITVSHLLNTNNFINDEE